MPSVEGHCCGRGNTRDAERSEAGRNAADRGGSGAARGAERGDSPIVACGAAPAGKSVRLKLENLQSIGSFKIRPIGNAVLARPAAELALGLRNLYHQHGQQRARRRLHGAQARHPGDSGRARERTRDEAREIEELGRADRHAADRGLVAGNPERNPGGRGGRLYRRGAGPGFACRRCDDRTRDTATVAGCRSDPDSVRRRRLGLRHRLRGARAEARGENHRLRAGERAPLECGVRRRRAGRNTACAGLRQRRGFRHRAAGNVAAGENP